MDANNSNQADASKAAADGSAASRIQRALDAGGGAGGAGGVDAGSGKDDSSAGAAGAAGKDAGKDGKDAGAAGADDTLAVSKSDLQKMIDDGVRAGLAAHQNERNQSDTRTRFIMQKMADIPPILHDLMPKSGDLKVLTQVEQDIRGAMKEWAAKAGFKTPDVGGGAIQAAKPMDLPQMNNNSASARVQRAINRGN